MDATTWRWIWQRTSSRWHRRIVPVGSSIASVSHDGSSKASSRVSPVGRRWSWKRVGRPIIGAGARAILARVQYDLWHVERRRKKLRVAKLSAA